jgi:hypothetical protein
LCFAWRPGFTLPLVGENTLSDTKGESFMKKRRIYAVVETSSKHVDYDSSPQAGTHIYGLYTDMASARRGFKDCLDIAQVHYNEEYGYKEASSLLVKDEDYALVVKVATRSRNGKLIFNSEMITIKIVTMK